jgi:hypothetical protein
VIVVQMMLAVRQRPRNEGGQADDGMRDFTHDAIDQLFILCDGAMPSIVSNAPHAPEREGLALQTKLVSKTKKAIYFISLYQTATRVMQIAHHIANPVSI